jgi:hypothetical protein
MEVLYQSPVCPSLPLLPLASPDRLDYDAANTSQRYRQHMRTRCTLQGGQTCAIS